MGRVGSDASLRQRINGWRRSSPPCRVPSSAVERLATRGPLLSGERKILKLMTARICPGQVQQ